MANTSLTEPEKVSFHWQLPRGLTTCTCLAIKRWSTNSERVRPGPPGGQPSASSPRLDREALIAAANCPPSAERLPTRSVRPIRKYLGMVRLEAHCAPQSARSAQNSEHQRRWYTIVEIVAWRTKSREWRRECQSIPLEETAPFRFRGARTHGSSYCRKMARLHESSRNWAALRSSLFGFCGRSVRSTDLLMHA